jgi:hypothetical protein
MPTKPKASAPAGSAEVKPSETKPKAPRRRAAPKRKPAAAKAATIRRPKAKETSLRSQTAMAKLQSAIDQLEAALQAQPSGEAAVPQPPLEVQPEQPSAPTLETAVREKPQPSLPNPAPHKPEVEVSPDVWSSMAKPAMATGAFLVFVATLMVGYSTGYAVGSDSVDDPMILVA